MAARILGSSVLAAFHPAVRTWFEGRLGEPTSRPGHRWANIRAGRGNTLIAAPTARATTCRRTCRPARRDPRARPDAARGPRGWSARATRPAASARRCEAAAAHPGHDAGVALHPAHERRRARDARDGATVIVDEIHALVRDKRGAHLALSLERLEALAGRPVQRIGLSATQKPLEEVGALPGRRPGGARSWTSATAASSTSAIEVPPVAALDRLLARAVGRDLRAMAELMREHRTTLVFVNTRKLAERIAAQLTELLGEDAVTSHHGSLSRERRLDAEQRLKAGTLRRWWRRRRSSWASTSATWTW